MKSLYLLAERISRAATWASAGLLFAAAAYITADVILRKLLGISLHGSDELAGYALAISTSWSLSFTLLRRANVRIDALYMRLPQHWTVWLDVAGVVLMGAFMAVVTWFTCELWLSSASMGATASTQLQTPLIIPQGLWVAGFLLFLFVLTVLLVRVCILLYRGDTASVSRIAGIRSVEEEVNDEVSPQTLRQLQQRSAHAD